MARGEDGQGIAGMCRVFAMCMHVCEKWVRSRQPCCPALFAAQIGAAVGKLKRFIIEPFVLHEQVGVVTFHCQIHPPHQWSRTTCSWPIVI